MMRSIFVLTLVISLKSFGQVSELPAQSPDKNFKLIFTTKEIGDASAEWKCWLITTNGDSILLTTSILHDMPAPITYWDKYSKKLIYEEQSHGIQEIRIYDLRYKKIAFKTNGFIWGHTMEYFDQETGTVIFFRDSNPDTNSNFDVLTLNIESLKIKKIGNVTTSGDSYTGSPEILKLDNVKREITVVYETPDNDRSSSTGKMKFSY